MVEPQYVVLYSCAAPCSPPPDAMGVGAVAQPGATSTGHPEHWAEVSNCPQVLKRSLSALGDENKGRRIRQRRFSSQHKAQTEPSSAPVVLPMHRLVLQHRAEPQPPPAALKGSLWPWLLRLDPALLISTPSPPLMAGSCTRMLL